MKLYIFDCCIETDCGFEDEHVTIKICAENEFESTRKLFIYVKQHRPFTTKLRFDCSCVEINDSVVEGLWP